MLKWIEVIEMCNIHHEDIRQIWTTQILTENNTDDDYDWVWNVVNEILESIEEGINTLCKDEIMKESVKGFFMELRGD